MTTAGTSIRETVPLLKATADIKLAGLVVSVDRMERGTGQTTALAEIRETYQMPTFAIVTVEDVIAHLEDKEINGRVVLDKETADRMRAYLETYGPQNA